MRNTGTLGTNLAVRSFPPSILLGFDQKQCDQLFDNRGVACQTAVPVGIEKEISLLIRLDSKTGEGFGGTIYMSSDVEGDTLIGALPLFPTPKPLPSTISACGLDAVSSGWQNCNGSRGRVYDGPDFMPKISEFNTVMVDYPGGSVQEIEPEGGWVLSFRHEDDERVRSLNVSVVRYSSGRFAAIGFHPGDDELREEWQQFQRVGGELFIFGERLLLHGRASPDGIEGKFFGAANRSPDMSPAYLHGEWDLTRLCPAGANWRPCDTFASRHWDCLQGVAVCRHR